ncbi:MAG: hypothetical protein HKM07_04750 [Chlamydiae bacterium]|nr:hypothetical protein [Chlamydiota bacterium]
MLLYKNFPKIETVVDSFDKSSSTELYSSSVRNALKRILPADVFYSEFLEDEFCEDWKKEFEEILPLVKWIHQEGSLNISVFLLCRYRLNAGKFFLDILSRWLSPGKRINVGLFFAADFKLPDISNQVYTAAEIVICSDQLQDVELIKQNLKVLESEIRLGVVSGYHASRILEIKGLSADEKTSLIQDRITALVQARPQDFDYDIFSQMQQFLVMCRDEFKVAREFQQMSRIIYIFYLFRKILRKQGEVSPDKRHLSLKLLHSRLHLPFGTKKVLSMFVGVNLLKENEIFEQRHLLKAIQNHFPTVRAIEDSFFVNENRDDRILTIYLEVEKGDGGDFSIDEIKNLRKVLPNELKSQVEHLLRPVFMPRNEEEVMRNIITLSQQLKYVNDIPQVIISFDEQTDADLSFTVILVRILKPESLLIQKLFHDAKTGLKFFPDRIRKVGMLRKRYPKEATVFRACLPNIAFLRSDHTVDLYKARQEVITELQKIIGEVRDFNGGMISKQIEVFLSLKKSLGDIGEKNEFLLENFYHSIFPVEMRSLIDSEPLKELFLLFLDLSQKSGGDKKKFELLSKEDEKHAFVMVSMQDFSLKQPIFDAVESVLISSPGLVFLHLQMFEVSYIGYIYFCDNTEKRQLFISAVQQALDF